MSGRDFRNRDGEGAGGSGDGAERGSGADGRWVDCRDDRDWRITGEGGVDDCGDRVGNGGNGDEVGTLGIDG